MTRKMKDSGVEWIDEIPESWSIVRLKQVFSLKEVSELIKIQMKSYPIEQAYDYFCIEFESALQVVFSSRDYNYPSKALTKSFESEIVRSAIMAFVNKIFIQRYLVKEF